MKKCYNVSFQWHDTNTWCANIAHAENTEAIENYYNGKGHKVTSVKENGEYDIESAQRKGMPIIEL